MQQAIASLQSTAASMKSFALETQDQQAKQTFQQLSDQLESAMQVLKERQKYIEEQEPQFKQI